MKPEEQRIAIAKACGWRGISEQFLVGYAPWRPVPYEKRILGNIEDIPLDPLPDYPNDLNAMHEAEKLFIGDASNAMTYAMHLLRVRGQDINNENDDLNCDHAWIAANATASERAEAFLKTLNLWQE